MNKIVYDLLLKLEECDDKHNRCDYLLEHSEITYLLEYIKELEEENKELKELNVCVGCNNNPNYKSRIDKAIEYIRSEYTITDDDVYLALYSSDGTLGKLEKILKGEK